MPFNRVSPAITEYLAQVNAGHEERFKSLKSLCDIGTANAIGYAPTDWAASERAIWCMGFVEALRLVREYIDSAEPPPRR